ncbi:Chaperone protein DnaJ [Paenibacillus plantiphilus]|uniref:Chaperone protein DnaJ n=1 Tax=Paenibacillus plantiphilus TaxID=2905650 RepID=A0ABM9BL46_9BACL|nr:DnaJ domain-containing protein [Paenibacillus plantiphilus]CAH1189917.1 Chaperone protein DnaJ [Paenibacillus plantiphilus]
MNYYELLEVSQAATELEIKTSYRQLVKRYHPDVNGGSQEAEQRFKLIKEAYEILREPKEREAYDARLRGSSSGKAGAGAFHSNEKTKESRQPNGGQGGSGGFDPASVAEQFGKFFGFDAKGNRSSEQKGASPRNPIDTSDMFNRYFGKKNK